MRTDTQPETRTGRNADATRRRILEAAYQEMHLRGFQGMRLDQVLAETGLTKGALYHHFPNKQALGYAVVEEMVREMVQQLWVTPLADSDDPLGELTRRVQSLDRLAGDTILTLGCPLNNLAQEMSPLDEGFRTRLDRLFELWRESFAETLERAQALGQVRPEVNCRETATLLMAALEGCIGIAKNAQSLERLRECAAGLAAYLASLRRDGEGGPG